MLCWNNAFKLDNYINHQLPPSDELFLEAYIPDNSRLAGFASTSPLLNVQPRDFLKFLIFNLQSTNLKIMKIANIIANIIITPPMTLPAIIPPTCLLESCGAITFPSFFKLFIYNRYLPCLSSQELSSLHRRLPILYY
jgi:hypothetical protein